jgi:hypothetical protein
VIQVGVIVINVGITATTMGPMPMRLLRVIDLGTDVLKAFPCRMVSVSRIAVINRKSTQRKAAFWAAFQIPAAKGITGHGSWLL